MNTIKKALGKLSEFAGIVVSCITGCVAGMFTITAIDATIMLTLGAVGIAPIAGIAGMILSWVVGLIYAIIYIVIALRVTDMMEKFIKQCHAEHKRKAYAYATH